MLYQSFGDTSLPKFMILHGGGLASWSLVNVKDILLDKFNVILVTIDGHDNSLDDFISIEKCSSDIVEHISKNYNGHIFALAGLSLGAQVVLDVLSLKFDITQFAIIESALVVPQIKFISLIRPIMKISYPLVNKMWFAKLQAKSLNLPNKYFNLYFKTSKDISLNSLINISLSNGAYSIKPSLKDTSAKVLVLVGSKEISCMIKSAELIHTTLHNSILLVMSKLSHGQLSLNYPQKYVTTILTFIENI